MEMRPDEIVVNYRQAKNKGQQIKILADLNLCKIEDIIQILVDHGGYERQRISRAIGAARKCSSPFVKHSEPVKLPKKEPEPEKIPYKKPEIILGPPEPKLKTYKQSIESALDTIKAEIEDINRQQYELDQRKADIYQKLQDMLGGVS